MPSKIVLEVQEEQEAQLRQIAAMTKALEASEADSQRPGFTTVSPDSSDTLLTVQEIFDFAIDTVHDLLTRLGGTYGSLLVTIASDDFTVERLQELDLAAEQTPSEADDTPTGTPGGASAPPVV